MELDMWETIWRFCLQALITIGVLSVLYAAMVALLIVTDE